MQNAYFGETQQRLWKFHNFILREIMLTLVVDDLSLWRWLLSLYTGWSLPGKPGILLEIMLSKQENFCSIFSTAAGLSWNLIVLNFYIFYAMYHTTKSNGLFFIKNILERTTYSSWKSLGKLFFESVISI